MFSKVLVANRGEIAVRIIRACKELGIGTVAVYSEADRDSLPVMLADTSVCIGGAQSSESYLNIPSIISAAEITDVDAIHPGYGFLAENAHFADICESCNIKFIGPDHSIIASMGDKIQAKETAKKAGVPVVPGSDGAVKTKEEARALAQKIGYPVIIKASAGGGGKGMRICRNDVSLASSILTAQREAETNFGNSEIYIEKFIEEPHHIEVQILGDMHGNVIHLGERDCSIQRRHQKLVEESPSPFVDQKLRKKLGDAAVKLSKAVNYQNAGTIEFLVDKHKNFYFMEMNTRIQVEHPVTELVTGVDLLKAQLRIASGEKIVFSQDEMSIKGSAIECRICAEDPDNNFMPSAGKIAKLCAPGGFGVRFDSHIYAGYVIPPYYDSMIGKLIAYAPTRDEAIQAMYRALDEFIIDPIKTTVSFHKKVMKDKSFVAGHFSTNFIDKYM